MALAIYSTATGRLRRVISNSVGETQSDDALLIKHIAGTGESALIVLDNLGIDGFQAAVTVESGKTPANDRYAVIHQNGDVENIIIADPLAGDSVRNKTLVASETARVGWRITRAGEFQRSLIEIDGDIAAAEIRRAVVFSDPLKGIDAPYTPEELIAKNNIKNAIEDALLTTLAAEKTARQGPR